VPRQFVVETKAIAVMADLVDAGRQIGISTLRRSAARQLPVGVVNRIRRILRECVQDVGDQQFLMLLLMMQTDFEQRKKFRRAVVGDRVD
jgi:hypothetical protein